MHLLLVEDDLDLGRSLIQAMRSAGHTVEWVRDVATAGHIVDAHRHECVLLDLNLPDGHGLDLLHRWRRTGVALPLIIITASDALGDRLVGLDRGADDVLVKPFVVDELIARIHAVTRRSARQVAEVWTIGRLSIDPQRREVKLDDEAVMLSPREFDVLLALGRNHGRVLPKHRLAQSLEPLGEPVDANALEVHVHHLRRKLGPGWIRTVRGVGYLLDDAGPEADGGAGAPA